MKKTKSLRADVILVVSLLVISLAAVTALLLLRKDGEKVVVEIDGKPFAEYSLYENREYILNYGKTILAIEDGKAYMKSADCPDRTCVKTGKISHVGESITCLPNRTHVYVAGKAENGVELVP